MVEPAPGVNLTCISISAVPSTEKVSGGIVEMLKYQIGVVK